MAVGIKLERFDETETRGKCNFEANFERWCSVFSRNDYSSTKLGCWTFRETTVSGKKTYYAFPLPCPCKQEGIQFVRLDKKEWWYRHRRWWERVPYRSSGRSESGQDEATDIRLRKRTTTMQCRKQWRREQYHSQEILDVKKYFCWADLPRKFFTAQICKIFTTNISCVSQVAVTHKNTLTQNSNFKNLSWKLSKLRY